MALGPRLELRQGQSLVMTPQLMQAIKLLQMSNLDLVAYVEAELERNPFLEPVTDQPERLDLRGLEREAAGETVKPLSQDSTREDWFSAELGSSASNIADRLDARVDDVFPEAEGGSSSSGQAGESSSYWTGVGSGRGPLGEEGGDFEDFATPQLSLRDHLETQLATAESAPARRLIGSFLIDMIDEAGYLVGDLDAAAHSLGTTRDEVLSVLGTIQRFDPSGVGARTLKECLAIQLSELNRYDPVMEAFVTHIELLAKRDLGALQKVCGVDAEDLSDMIAEIRALSPKPGLAFATGTVQTVTADVFVRTASDGGWSIELNPENLPRVLVNQSYFARVSRSSGAEQAKPYLAECIQTANWLVKSLDQRAKTILKVSTEIVRQQDAFLTNGVEYLRPLNLKTIADAIGMHESTVSRVTSNKYLGTPRGVFEMKYFFTSSIQSADGGEAHSAEAVRFRIKQLIDGENPREILSDDTIVDILKKQGVDIARRTVAKYREALRIPSSVERRRAKAS
jgi:RNA polymerase sigma-54 factor